MRLIDLDELPKGRVEWEDIFDAPTVDAVEVVRCKDCKEYKYCFLLPNDDDYCSKGERKEEWQED